MENNEQMNQNIQNQNVENANKKAIDANEKKKIVKLTQPNILPNKVRIEVSTLVENESVVPQDEVLPELEVSAEVEEAAEEEEALEENFNLEGMTKEQLVELLEETVKEDDLAKIKDKVAAIRIHFNKLNKIDLDQEMEQFLQSGGDAQTFQHIEDSIETRFTEAFNIFKSKRAHQNEAIEAQKLENLAKKQALLEDLKQMISSETLKKTYDEFRALQERWKEIGQVPATENANLWNSYHFLVEQFFDKVRIGRELRDLDMKKNLDAKVELCEKAEELLNEKSLTKAFQELQKLHEQWKEVGPVPQEKKDEIWDRFKAATDKINQIRREHFSKILEEQNANFQTKTALCEKAEEIVNGEYSSINSWQKKSTELTELFQVWKTVGAAAKKENEEVWARFKSAMDTFFTKKKEYFSTLKDQQTENLERKTQICIEAEALMESTEWKNASDRLKKLQEEWKAIGPVPKRHTDKIWKRFRAACDAFFNRKSEHFSGLRGEEEANLEAKKSLLEEVKAFQLSASRNENMEALKAFQRRWLEIGHVPMKYKDAINKEFRGIIDGFFDTMRKNQDEASTNEYREMMAGLKDDPEGRDKVKRERTNLQNKIQKLRDEISVLENNIGFFSSSKNSELMRAEYEKKINKAKNDLKVLEAKLRITED